MMTVFLNRAGGKRRVAVGAPYPWWIVAGRLSEIGGGLGRLLDGDNG
jgi:hypothetical protein